MKDAIIISLAVFSVGLIPPFAHASPIPNLEQRINTSIAAQSAPRIQTYFAAPDERGTPLIIKLARQGDVRGILQAKSADGGQFLIATDSYGNNVFHAAKNADTVQVIASLIRQFYGAQAPRQIAALVDARNIQGETPLLAQINAGHADTFSPLYAHSTLKKKNDATNRQLVRLHGMDESIAGPNREIYCEEIIRLSSAGGRTLLQAAQDQTPYYPEMAAVVRNIGQEIPCLVK